MKEEFVWGAATSACQIEGAFDKDGKGISIWDVFSHEKGRIFENQNADTACDHYHRMREDVQLMKKIGLQAYRFSISWPRIIPDGTGKVNQAGLQFYANLADELLKNGIVPYATLYHWDLPEALQKRGGFLSEESPEWFANYAEVVGKHLGGKIKNFFTVNEPQCFIGGAFRDGMFAPGEKKQTEELIKMTHHVLLCHGRAVEVLRRCVPGCRVGYAPTGVFYLPKDDKEENIQAAWQANFEVNEQNWVSGISWWSDPVIFGRYPKGCEKLTELVGKFIRPGDMETICRPLDFYGQNIYQAEYVEKAGDSFRTTGFPPGYPRTAIGWKVVPEAMYWIPKFLYKRYGIPIMITENGISCHDWISLDGKVHDPNRIDFLSRYLAELARASEDGTDVRGYFHWSLMDNFEWANGYNERFGFIYVDYETGERTVKDSGYWYREVIRHNGANLIK